MNELIAKFIYVVNIFLLLLFIAQMIETINLTGVQTGTYLQRFKDAVTAGRKQIEDVLDDISGAAQNGSFADEDFAGKENGGLADEKTAGKENGSSADGEFFTGNAGGGGGSGEVAGENMSGSQESAGAEDSGESADVGGIAAVSFAGEEELTAETAATIGNFQEITVLITNKGEGGYWHSTLSFSFASDVVITTGSSVTYLEAGGTLELDATDYAAGESILLEMAAGSDISEERSADGAEAWDSALTTGTETEEKERIDSPDSEATAVSDPEEAAVFSLDFGTESGGDDVRTYAGIMKIIVTEDGFLLRNTLSLEEYLRYVVPAEMPASYPEEALKAQAICARTYALYSAVSGAFAEYGADISDDTSCQVYNTQGTDERTDAAVWATAGEYLVCDGEAAECYYFSTSCGVTTDAAIWGEEIPYLQSVLVSRISVEETEQKTAEGGATSAENSELSALENGEKLRDEGDSGSRAESGSDVDSGSGVESGSDEDSGSWEESGSDVDSESEEDLGIGELLKNEEYLRSFLDGDVSGAESEEPWYRWEAAYSPELLAARLEEEIGEVLSLEVTQRGSGGVAVELTIYGSRGRKVLDSQYAIREFFRMSNGASCIRQDGTEVSGSMILPSAFFYIQVETDGTVTLVGGGFGHGCGMSQNAAKAYANAGVDAYEILSFFYPGTKIYRAEK